MSCFFPLGTLVECDYFFPIVKLRPKILLIQEYNKSLVEESCYLFQRCETYFDIKLKF